MYKQTDKVFWCIVALMACTPALIREIPDAYDYLLIIIFVVAALAVAVLQIYMKQKVVSNEPHYKSRHRSLHLLLAVLSIACLGGLILSGKLVEFRTFYRVLIYLCLAISMINVGLQLYDERNAK